MRTRVGLLSAAAIVAAIAIRIVVVGAMDGPVINADESGYLVNARAIGAGDPASSTAYYPGYSAIISPGFVSDGASPMGNYRAVLAINVALAAGGAAAVVALARRVRPEIGMPAAVLIAAMVSVLPSWLTYAPLVMSENALIPVLFLLAVAATTPMQHRSVVALVLLGTAAGLTWALHPRALTIPFVYGIVGVVVLRHRRRQLAAFVGAVAIGLAGSLALRRLIESWQIDAPSNRVTTAQLDNYSVGELVSRLTRGEVLEALLGTAAGQLGYLLAAGSIFLVAGVLGSTPSARRLWRGEHDGMDQVRVLSVLLLAVTAALSIAYWAGRPGRADGAVYGRYTEPAALVVIALGAIAVVAGTNRRVEHWRLAALGAVVAGAAVATLGSARLFLPDTIREGVAISVNVPAVLAYTPTASISLTRMMIVAVLAAVAISIAAAVGPRVAVGAVFVALLAVHAAVLLPDRVRSSEQRGDQRVVASTIERFFADVDCVAYDRATFDAWHFFNSEFFLDGRTVERVWSPDREQPCGGVVISGRRDLQVDYPGARLLTLENRAAQDLWVLPAAQAGIEHLLFPGDPAADLADDAMAARVELLDDSMGSRPFADRMVEVWHDGTGSPWPNRMGLGENTGHVVLGARWFGPEGELASTTTIDLDRTLLPGDSLVLSLSGLVDRDLADGRYRVEIDVVQHGASWFSDVGGTALVFEDELVG